MIKSLSSELEKQLVSHLRKDFDMSSDSNMSL